MPILTYVTDRDIEALRQALKIYLPQETIYDFREDFAPDLVEAAIVWKHPPGSLQAFSNLKMISSLGAGVEHLLEDDNIPAHVSHYAYRESWPGPFYEKVYFGSGVKFSQKHIPTLSSKSLGKMEYQH